MVHQQRCSSVPLLSGSVLAGLAALSRLLLCMLLLSSLGTRGIGTSLESDDDSVMYVAKGATVLLPGVNEDLKDGVVTWILERSQGQMEDILNYHIQTPEAEIQDAYEKRVTFFLVNSSFLLHNLSENDEGLYKIIINLSSTYRCIRLQVVESLTGASILNHSFNAECTLQLYCQVVGEVWNMTWKKDGGDLPDVVTLLNDSMMLKMDRTGSDLSGTYTCIAQNPITTVQGEYVLQQRAVPWEVMVSASSASVALTLSLLALLNTLVSSAALLLTTDLGFPAWFLKVCDISSNLALVADFLGWTLWSSIEPFISSVTVVVFLSIVLLSRICHVLWRFCKAQKPVYMVWNSLSHLFVFASSVTLVVLSMQHGLDCNTFLSLHKTIYILSITVSLLVMIVGILIFRFCKKKSSGITDGEKSKTEVQYQNVETEGNIHGSISSPV